MRPVPYMLGCLACIAVGFAVLADEPARPQQPKFGGGSTPKVEKAVVDGKLTVIGQATVKAEPDIAYFNFTVTTQAGDSSSAMAGNALVTKKVLAKLTGLGIKKNEVQTTDYSVQEATHNEEIDAKGRKTYKTVKDGYAVHNTLRVTVCKVEDLGGLLDAVGKEDSVTVGGIKFDSTKREELLDEARDKAGKNAIAKSQKLAKTLGVTVDGLLLAEESTTSEAPRQLYSRSADVAGEATTIQSGTLTFAATVTVTYKVK